MKTILFFFLLCAPLFAAAQTPDSTAIKQVDSLIQVSRALIGKRDFDKALDVNVAAEQIALEKLGRESAAYGSCCFNRARVNSSKNDYPEAVKWCLESKAIREKALGKEHPVYAESLHNLAWLYKKMGDNERTLQFYQEAIAIRAKVLGKDHLDYAQSLYNLAVHYMDIRNYEKAEGLYLEILAIWEKALGKEHPNYLWCFSDLAVLYYEQGNYEKALPLTLEAKARREKVLGKEHPDYARSLQNLALLYNRMGNYEKEESLRLEAVAIGEKTLGKEHPGYAWRLNDLAILYHYQGNYEKAERFHLEAKAIREKVLGKEHPDYAASLDNLAQVYSSLGNTEKALLLYHEAKTVREKTLGKEHIEYARNLNNLGILYDEMGNYEEAEPLYLEALAIWEKVLGKEHPEYTAGLENLAIMYTRQGNYEKAERLHLESKAIREKTLGKEHPDYAQSLHNLAALYWEGNTEKAEPLYLEAIAVREKALGKEHPDYASSLSGLVNVYEAQKRFSESDHLQEELAGLYQTRLARSATFLSERELSNYAATFQLNGNKLINQVFIRPAAQVGTMPMLGYNHALFFKGFLLHTVSRLNTLSTSNPDTREMNNHLKGYRRRLAAEYAKPIAERKGVEELEEKANAAEKELARMVSGYAEALRQVEWAEVQSALKEGEAVIEFVHFQVNFPEKTDSTMYAALLLFPGAPQPLFIPLFEEKQLVELLAKNLQDKNFAQVYAGRGATPLKTAGELYGLYEIFWKPLGKHLRNVKTVFYSPSGLLHRINFDAIPVGNKQTLTDRFRLVRLSSSRSLVVPDLTKTDTANAAILFGGIQYEMDSTAIRQDSIPPEVLPAVNSPELAFSYADRSVPSRGENWGYLPGTATEVSEIQGLFQKSNFASQVFSGEKADEESFKLLGKSKNSPRVLHVATHGFFFPDPKTTSARFETSPTLGAAEPVFKISDHPMLRSGLILAGGNAAWQGAKTLEGREDGILTAYEISQMNLSNTELVVLSACETGLGDIQGNEGVYGLQRAFKIAGAKYLVMSLWQVPDQETAVFMTTFYKHWLTDKQPIPEAFRNTQKEMRERFINPYQWAGFVLVE